MIKIRILNEIEKHIITIKNEPFNLIGEVIPSFNNLNWDYKVKYYPKEKLQTMIFPNEDYSLKSLNDSIFIGAYDDDKLIGLLVLEDGLYKYIYLDELKVNERYRNKGIGKMLIKKAIGVAKNKDYKGIYTIVQNNNLGAFLFYIKCNFYIGGVDTNIYKFTKQSDKFDIYMYMDF